MKKYWGGLSCSLERAGHRTARVKKGSLKLVHGAGGPSPPSVRQQQTLRATNLRSSTMLRTTISNT